MTDTSDPIITLRAGALSLDLAPRAGGVIAGFRHGDTLIMRPPDLPGLAAGNPRAGASWPLVPYSNRIRNGRFPWRGKIIELERDWLSKEHAIHGNGWRRPWSVHDLSASAVTMKQRHAGDGFWPFSYEAQQSFALTPDGFTLWMAVTNSGAAPMPAGLGHHPYFHRTPDATLRVTTRELWETDDEKLPTRRVKVPPLLDFTAARRVDPLGLDGIFVGWMRPARIEWPAARLALNIAASSIFERLVIFIPPGEPFFAVEPVSHDTDAFNHLKDDTGVKILGPGETLQGEMSFIVQRLPAP